jgi:hypothetical protein
VDVGLQWRQAFQYKKGDIVSGSLDLDENVNALYQQLVQDVDIVGGLKRDFDALVKPYLAIRRAT